MRPDPPSLTLRPGEQGTIAIRVDNAADVYGVELHLRFDPALVEVVDAQPGQPGTQIAAGDWLAQGFAAVNKADNTAGTIDYAVTLINPAPALSGGGAVAVITFKGKAAGTSPLTVQKAIIASRQGKEIASQWQNGAITVAGAAGATAPPPAQPTPTSTACASSATPPPAPAAPATIPAKHKHAPGAHGIAHRHPATTPQRQAIGAGGLAIPVVLVIGLGLLVVVRRRRT